MKNLKKYGKLTSDDLRALLLFVPLLEKEKSELDEKLAVKVIPFSRSGHVERKMA